MNCVPFSFFSALFMACLILTGCEGGQGSTKQFVDTGTPSGDLRAVRISPAPGTAFITRRSVFRISWPEGTLLPTFEVELQRYKEEHNCNDEEDVAEDQEQETKGQATRLERQGDAFIWDLVPEKDLGGGGIYFVHLISGSDEIRAAYVIDDNRSAATAAFHPHECARRR